MRKLFAFASITFLFSIKLFSQNSNIIEGNKCYEKGDYNCAIKEYQIAIISSKDSELEIAKLNLMSAQECVKLLADANSAFNNRNFSKAQELYNTLLEYNPSDPIAKTQLDKCRTNSTPKLRKATSSEITDIWNNKYGLQPQRRQNLINVGIDPDDAQLRINNGEGKPKESTTNLSTTTLDVSKTNLYFSPSGFELQEIKIFSNAKNYVVPKNLIPSWCKVYPYDGYIKVSVEDNPNTTSRKDWFKVVAGDKELRIYVEQAGQSKTNNSTTNKNYSQNTTPKINKSTTPNYTYSSNEPKFNAPKSNEKWALNFGFGPSLKNQTNFDCTQLGIKFEKLMKYGFGFNTGLNLEGYSLQDSIPFVSERSFTHFGINIPLHLEYRLNFARWFNVYAYAGVGINAITDYEFDQNTYPSSYEYGLGCRINKLQFTVGQSQFQDNQAIRRTLGTNTYTYNKITYSLAVFF